MTLPNDSVLVTPGAGATIATHTIAGKEYQVVLLGDSAGHILDSLDTWWAWANDVAFAANKHHITLFNGTGSGKIVKVRKLFAVNLQAAAITGIMVRFDCFRVSTSSAGTVITANAADTNNAALPGGIVVRTNATVTLGSQLFGFATTNEEIGTTGTLISGTHILASYNQFPEGRAIQELTLREDQGVTMQQITSSTVGSFGWLCVFTLE